MKLILLFVLYLSSIGLIFLCCEKTRPERKMEASNMIKRNGSYYYKREDVEKFLHKLKTIKIGDNYSAIISRLGPPTHDKKLYPKKIGSAPIVRVLDYYIRIYKKNLVNERFDIYVRLELRDDDTLKKIQSFPNDWFEKWPKVSLPD